MMSSKILLNAIFVIILIGYSTATVGNGTCTNSLDCLEGNICEKELCVPAPKTVIKRHSRVFHDRPQSLCVLPLVCFP